jgi:predicted O-methyltransferase YrrM
VDTVIEIGTAAGVSTAILCDALATAHRSGELGADYRVISYDVRDTFYLDPSRAVGDAVHEMLDPELVAHIEFRHPATALTLREHHAPNELSMLFIDADHRHPWPALDLLATLDLLRPGAEVVLHDINLPIIAPQYADWGAKHVFDELSAKKYADLTEDPPNVGSLIVPEDKGSLREQLVAIVDAHEWEVEVPDEMRAELL